MAKKYYSIRSGKKIGVFYDEWNDVKKYVEGFPNAEYKGFKNKEDAELYLLSFEDKKIDKKSFDVNIYCDGSFNPSRLNSFSSGAVIIKDDKIIYKISKRYQHDVFAKTRNVAGEVMAVLEALKYCNENNLNNILFFVDYQGLISWWNGSWKANNEVSLFFLSELKKYENLNFSFEKVEAHTGVEYNELADELAKKGEQLSFIE